MSNKGTIIQAGKQQFRDKLAGGQIEIAVPEWGGAVIRHNRSATVAEYARIMSVEEAAGKVAAEIEALIICARADDGAQLFGDEQRQAVLREFDPVVVRRLGRQIYAAVMPAGGIEEAAGN